jgi:hypothetical protein
VDEGAATDEEGEGSCDEPLAHDDSCNAWKR